MDNFEERLIRLESKIDNEQNKIDSRFNSLENLLREVKAETKQITDISIELSRLDGKSSSAHKRLDDFSKDLQGVSNRLTHVEKASSSHNASMQSVQKFGWMIVAGLVGFFFWFIQKVNP